MISVVKSLKILLIIFLLSVSISDGRELSNKNRKALVIGNAKYDVAPLKNPINDAKGITKSLEGLGFQVTKVTDLDFKKMEEEIREFSTNLAKGDVALFYFSGHGSQVNGFNYLIPIDNKIYSEDEIKYKAVNLNMILDKLELSESSVKIIILDACRSNPFKGFRTVNSGLAEVYPPKGTIISFATAPGKVAYDGTGDNSPYTGNLIKIIKTYGLKIEDVFKLVRKAVLLETSEKQIPWESTCLTGDFYFSDVAIPAERSKENFRLPSSVHGYIFGEHNSYIHFNSIPDTIKKNEIVDIVYELLDLNIIDEISPLIVEISEWQTPNAFYICFDEQYEINPGKNLIRVSANYRPGIYTESVEKFQLFFTGYFSNDSVSSLN